ncbi:MAG TPA: translation initiation factor IF-2 [Xanthobacteraceae bacterium]|nr:translation initiation factor IF-2 [Xanthobacteraceae bacterium]
MTETKHPGEKLTVAPAKGTLSLKRPGIEQGVVKQSFSHGRTKTVMVEKVKSRRPDMKPEPAPAAAPAAGSAAGGAVRRGGVAPRGAAPAPSTAPAPTAPKRSSGLVLPKLTTEEHAARMSALESAKVREAEERRIAEAEEARRRERETVEQGERKAAEARKREEEDRRRHEEEAKQRAEREATKRFGDGEAKAKATTTTARAKPTSAPLNLRKVVPEADDDEGPRTPRRPGAPARPAAPARPTRGAGGEKRRGRLTVQNAADVGEVRERSVASFRRRTQRLMRGAAGNEAKEKLVREVTIPEAITIQELANRMAERAVDVIRLLMKQGQMFKITDVIDADTAQLVAEELGHTVKRVAAADVEEGLFDIPDNPEDLSPRPPVVTIMGHVDHGKTSLLDAIRSTNVTEGEAGGITQHIGAYQVTAPSGAVITFIDTPGHAAFTAMRARGAKVTDIVVLVVAADDGVMPQTVEAIQHAKAAKVPMIVAINKMDKPDAKPERVRTELLQHEVQVESLGGDVLDVEVSATKKTNLDKLLETIGLQAEILDLKANPYRPAEGTVIEAKLDRGRGPVATVLIQRGTLHVGDIVVAGAEWGRVRALISDTGESVELAGPSVPVEVLGFNGTPEASDRLAVVEDEARAREVTDYRARERREKQAARAAHMRGSLEQMMSQLKTSGRKEFPLVIKGDVQGSVEAIVGALEKLGTSEVAARILLAGVGGITESDVTLAEASGAAIIGFNVRAHKEAREAAERTGTEIRYYNIIYNLVDDVKKAMSGLLAPTLRETMLGNAMILEVFNISKVGKVAGCRVTDGVVERGANVRLIRDNVVIHEGKLSQLKRFKDDAREVTAGQECGMAFENYQDMRPGDVIECYRVEQIQRSL